MFLVILFSFLFFSFTSSECVEPGILWKKQCFFFYYDPDSFVNAEIKCIGIGGHLASIHDAFTNSLIHGKIFTFKYKLMIYF